MMLWQDRKGRFAPLKAGALLAMALPGLWLAYRLGAGQLGAKPITAALHETGLWSVRLLLITLAVTPFRLITGNNRILQIRRLLGVGALCYALIHLGLYIFDQNFNLVRVAIEIVLRFYLTIGFISLAAMTLLGLTATDSAIRRLGAPAWNRLHQLIYPLTILAIFHGFLQARIDVGEDVVMTGILLALMGIRWMRGRVAITPLTTAGLALVCMLLAGLIELAWYGLATGVSPQRIFDANFIADLQPRPALSVGLILLVLPALALGMRWRRSEPRAVRDPRPQTS